jgi:UDP-2,3-diacylglucosamine pyrophosphatase LpxH
MPRVLRYPPPGYLINTTSNMKNKKRQVEVVIISDIHLGTYGCHAHDLLKYLRSIEPKQIILNGGIIDVWQFSKRFWPASHMLIIKYITSMLSKGTEVIYIPGNHDEMMRKFVGFTLGNFSIENKVVLRLNGTRTWVFHGDVFDITMKNSKWLAKMGAVGYDSLILLNTFVNFLMKKAGRGKISLSKKIKDGVKSAVKFINDFEVTAADIAISNEYDYVACGHIHQPQKRTYSTDKGSVVYLNSGDWIENLTALEYNQGEWNLYYFMNDPVAQAIDLPDRTKRELNNQDIFRDLINEFILEQT